MMRIFSLFFFGFLTAVSPVAAQDSLILLNVEEVLAIVRLNHPVVKQADLSIEQASAEIRIARGAFNPMINTYIAQKKFDNTNYYTYQQPSVTIPTWYGVEASAGLENLIGDRLNPSQTVGKTAYVGVSVPVLKNLIFDKRRAQLQQAKVIKEQAVSEQRVVVNSILLEAAEQYWSWVYAYKAYDFVGKNLATSKERFELVKKAFAFGERPEIDTVEALTQVQNFEYQYSEAWLGFVNEGLMLSTFLWTDDGEPFNLPAESRPADGWENEESIRQFTLNLEELITTALKFHPELAVYNQKLAYLGIDKKLKFQELLPKLDLQYNLLSKGYSAPVLGPNLLENNYQYGIKFQMPLFLSQGRGEYKKSILKIEQTQFAVNQKMFQVEVKVKSYYNELITLRNQVKLQSSAVSNYNRLLKAEETLFENGESSLFVINNRELKVLDNQRKLIELKTKFHKTIYALQWSAGILQ